MSSRLGRAVDKLRQDRALLICVLLVFYALSVSASAVLTSKYVIGADYYFHLDVATFYSKGDFLGGMNYILTNIYFPYPPLFHILMVPSVWSGDPQLFARVAEILFMPVTYALVLRMVIKYAGSKPAVFTGLIMLGCWSFMDGALQVRPESLDLLLYPLIVGAVLSERKTLFSWLSLATIYSHGPAALSNVYGFALSKFREKKWRRPLLHALVLALPIIAVSLLYANGAMVKWGGYSPTENPQEAEFWNAPFPFVPAYMGVTLIGLVYVCRNLLVMHNNYFMGIWASGRSTLLDCLDVLHLLPAVYQRLPEKLSEFESLLTWGFMGSLIMFPMWADRWMHYASIPLACLAGIGIARMTGKKQLALGILVISAFMIYYAMWIMMSANGVWWQPGD